MPLKFVESLIVPFVKYKSGDFSDVNNYKAIALSTAMSKVFECILLEYFVSNDDIDLCPILLFGFTESLSITICTNVLKTVVEYYTSKDCHVFSYFVDFNKAFDKVNYRHLFTELLNESVSTCIVSLLAYWYSNHAIAVKWLHVIFDTFGASNVTK